MAAPFYTIGHGTRPLQDFVELVTSVAVTLVVDVRTVPRSRTNPQYNREALPQSLEPFGIGYEHIASLGGLRGRARRCVIMCAETVWWRCHRRIITDYLLAAGERVFHILGADHVEEAHMTDVARLRADGRLVYAAGQGAQRDLFK